MDLLFLSIAAVSLQYLPVANQLCATLQHWQEFVRYLLGKTEREEQEWVTRDMQDARDRRENLK